MTEQTKPGQNLWSPAEVAAYFGVHRQTVYTWIREGRIRAFKLSGRLVRIPVEEVDRMRETGRQGEACWPERAAS
jgi:excisionase family DNA binding protein